MASKARLARPEVRRQGEPNMRYRQRMMRTAEALYAKADDATTHGSLDRAAGHRARAEGFERCARNATQAPAPRTGGSK